MEKLCRESLNMSEELIHAHAWGTSEELIHALHAKLQRCWISDIILYVFTYNVIVIV